MSKIVVGIQARLGSERLPGKVLLKLGGITVIERIYSAATQAQGVSGAWVLTGPQSENQMLIDFCVRHKIPWLSGHATDVQSRYVVFQEQTGASAIIRLTGDNPLVRAQTIESVATAFVEDPSLDYASNCLTQSWPLGLNVEGVSAAALAKVATNPTDTEREHVTLRFKKQPRKFRIREFPAPKNLAWPDLRLTIDERQDFLFLQKLFKQFNEKVYDIPFLISQLRTHPEMITNSSVLQKVPV